MKLLKRLFFLFSFWIVFSAYALDQDVQVDLLMSKIIKADKEGRSADALPSFAKLESMEPNLNKPLSEAFHFMYIDTLYKAGDHANALRRANIYMEKFGKRGRNYAKVIDIMSSLEEEADRNIKEAAERRAAEKRAENERIEQRRAERERHCKRVEELSAKIDKLADWASSQPGVHACGEFPSCSRKWDEFDDERKEERRLCNNYRND